MSETVTVNLQGTPVTVPVEGLFTGSFDLRFTTFYNRRPTSLLNQLCDKYGSDKGEIVSEGHPYRWASHSYADFVERLFGHCREHVRSVFECGLGTNNPALKSSMGVNGRPGASLRVWRDYFPNARVWGADIDRDILFEEERIATHYCDQTDPEAIRALWAEIPDVAFDLMIDDGLHTYEAGVSLFEGSIHRLRTGGVYIIEDVTLDSMLRFAKYFAATDYAFELVTLYRKTARLGDNNLVVIRK